MFVLPAVVASLALRDSTDAFEAHWPDQAPTRDTSPRRVRQGSRLALMLTLLAARSSR